MIYQKSLFFLTSVYDLPPWFIQKEERPPKGFVPLLREVLLPSRARLSPLIYSRQISHLDYPSLLSL